MSSPNVIAHDAIAAKDVRDQLGDSTVRAICEHTLVKTARAEPPGEA